ncbi:DUF3696 domain-containing protein, partial [Escherichia coli]
NRLIRCVCGKKIGPDPRNFNQRVSLGRNDLLIRTFPMFLVETHSEHILLRILKRIRQTTDNELPESNYPVKPDFISVIVFEDNNGSTVTRKIDITDDGDFKQKWPKGFFEERRGELF